MEGVEVATQAVEESLRGRREVWIQEGEGASGRMRTDTDPVVLLGMSVCPNIYTATTILDYAACTQLLVVTYYHLAPLH